MATLTTTIQYSEPAGTIITSLGTPGPAGPGVPPGGSAGQILSKIDGVSYNTEWIDPTDDSAVWGQITGDLTNQGDLVTALAAKYDATNPAGYITSSALTGYALESWVTSQLGSYLTISSASSTYYPLTNPSGYITSAALTGYATQSWVTGQGYLTAASASSTYYPLTNPAGYITSSALAGYATESWVGSNYYPLTNPAGYIADAPFDGTTYGRKNGDWVAAGGTDVVWGQITGDLVNQLDLQAALDSKYDASNPAGYITSGSLAGYATESWVSSQGYLTSADLSGYATESWVSSQGYLLGSTAADTYQTLAGMVNYAAIAGASFTGLVVTKASNGAAASLRIPLGTAPSSPTFGDIWNSGSALSVRFGTSTETIANQSWVTSQGYITSSALTGYAQLSGGTFTGKVNFTSVGGAAGLNVGIGGTSTSATVNGDLWITTGGTNLNFRDGTGAWRILVNTSNTNTFSSPQIIDTTSNTLAGLRITQKGTSPAFVVEDATNPDTTATVIDQNGNLGVGVDAATWAAANKVEIVGAVKAQSITFDGSAQFKVSGIQAHATGANTNDLLVSYNGSTYRIPMIFVSTP